MEACILVFNTKKAENRNGKVIFINATDLVVRKNTESFITPEQISFIKSLFFDYVNVQARSAVVKNSAIASKNYSLSTKLYVKRIISGDYSNYAESINSWRSASNAMNKSFNALFDQLNIV